MNYQLDMQTFVLGTLAVGTSILGLAAFREAIRWLVQRASTRRLRQGP